MPPIRTLGLHRSLTRMMMALPLRLTPLAIASSRKSQRRRRLLLLQLVNTVRNRRRRKKLQLLKMMVMIDQRRRPRRRRMTSKNVFRLSSILLSFLFFSLQFMSVLPMYLDNGSFSVPLHVHIRRRSMFCLSWLRGKTLMFESIISIQSLDPQFGFPSQSNYYRRWLALCPNFPPPLTAST